jgi:uncharacterized membrane protein YhiD involved in acid resistance
MKATLWTLLVVALGAAVYFTNFSHLSGGADVATRVVSGVVAVGAGVGLWLARGEKDAS